MPDAITHRPNCEAPDACAARGAGHCRRCHFRSVAKALNADPEFRAKVSAASSARMKELNADPEFKAKTSARMKALNAEKIKSLGLRDHEVREWRAIRAKGFSREEAARIVICSRKDEAA